MVNTIGAVLRMFYARERKLMAGNKKGIIRKIIGIPVSIAIVAAVFCLIIGLVNAYLVSGRSNCTGTLPGGWPTCTQQDWAEIAAAVGLD